MYKRQAHERYPITVNRGYTQEVVTDRTGVNVGLYEIGKTNMTVVILAVLSNFYGVTPDEFFQNMEYEK